MNDAAARIRASAWWLVPLVLLILVIGWELDWGRALHPGVPAAEPIAPKPVVTSLLPEYAIDGGLAGHAETVNRTLFNPTRRPAPVVAEAAKQRMQRGLYVLTGTTVSGDRALAFLKEKSGGKAVTVKQGATISGMLVAEVAPDRVKLTLGDESEELVLKVATNARPTPQPAAPPAPIPAGAIQPAPGGPPQVTNAAVPQSPEVSLAERRRAARAAAGQAQAGQAGTAAAQPGTAAAVQGAGTATPSTTGAPPAVPPGWEHLYRGRQAN